MNFAPTEDQTAFLDSLARLVAQTGTEPADGRRSFFSARLDAALGDSGLLDAAAVAEFGPLAAALLVDAVARLPAVVEVGASALLRPLLCPEAPRPLAVIDGAPGRPARFLGEARSVLFLDDDGVFVAGVADGDRVAVDGFFAYPMARLRAPGAVRARALRCGAAAPARRLLQVATACEIAGALSGALDAVTEHVRTRRQFGRPLGSFQAVQHRLAGAAAAIAAARLLARRAACLGDPAEALTALGYAQDHAGRIVADLHQFMGAMGLTLEHPLYRWTYRVRLLLSDGGGATRPLRALAAAAWPDGPEARA